MLLALAVIAVIASGALAAVYVLTKGSIDQVNEEKTQTAMTNVLPNFDGTNREGFLFFRRSRGTEGRLFCPRRRVYRVWEMYLCLSTKMHQEG